MIIFNLLTKYSLGVYNKNMDTHREYMKGRLHNGRKMLLFS